MKQTSWEPGNTATAGLAAQPPYQGLARYEADGEQWFFGREDITELVAFLAEQQSALPLMLVGASGAGKSSLLRAGLLPRLRAAAGERATGTAASGERVAVYDLTVGGVPALAADMAKAVRAIGAGTRPGTWDRDLPAAVLVDQFEAVFTLCQDEAQRSTLISALCEVARSTLVVLALRADCYGRAIGYPGLLRALQERQVVLGPMNAGQLRRAVTEPAERAGAGVEDGLAEVVLADLAPADRVVNGDDSGRAHPPGALPLLSHALLSAWRHADGGPLTIAGYRAAGGVAEALRRSAERVYESLTPSQRRAARQLLPRLVATPDGLPPTRVPVPLGDLSWSRTGDTGRVLSAFAAERIITTDSDHAYFTHDIVLTAWPRLRAWIDEDADGQRAQLRIQQRAAASRTRKSPPAAEEAKPQDDSGPAAREHRPPRLEAGPRPLRRLAALLGVLVLVAAGLAAYAFTARGQADSSRQTAEAATQAADSRAVAFVADAARGTDPAAAAQLAVAAYAISPTVQAASSVLDSAAGPSVARIDDAGGTVSSISVSRDGKLLVAAAADGSLRLWNIAAAARPVALATLVPAGQGQALEAVAFSPDGTMIAAGLGPSVQLWRVSATGSSASGNSASGNSASGNSASGNSATGSSSASTVTPLGAALAGPGGTVSAVAFSSGGGLLAAGTENGTVRLWHVDDPAPPSVDGGPLTVSGGAPVTAVAFGEGGVLAAGTASGAAVLWHVSVSGAPVPYPRMPLTGTGAAVTDLAFSPTGATLAATGGAQVRLWTVQTGTGKKYKGAAANGDGTLSGAAAGTTAVAFSADGKSVAAGTADSKVLVWDAASRALTATVGQPKPVTSVSWDGGRRVAAAGEDGTVALIALPTPVLAAGNSPAAVAYRPDGDALAVGGTDLQLRSAGGGTLLASHPLPAGTRVTADAFSAGGVIAAALSDGTVQLFNGTTLKQAARAFPVTAKPGPALSVGFSADGTLLVTGAADGTVRLYDVSAPGNPRRVAIAAGGSSAASSVALAPDGATLAEADTKGSVRLWNVAAGHSLTAAGTFTGVASGGTSVLAFSADSKTLVVGADGSGVQLWNVRDTAQPVALGLLASGAARSAAFSRNGGLLAVGNADGSVQLWNVASPAQPVLTATLRDATGDVTGVAFSLDGSRLAAGDEGTVHQWDTSPAAAVAGICGGLGQALSAADWAGYVSGVPYQAPCPASR